MSKLTIRREGCWNGKVLKKNISFTEWQETLQICDPFNHDLDGPILELKILNLSTNNIQIEEPINIIKISSQGEVNLTYTGDIALTGKVEITNGGVYNLMSPCGYDLTFSYNGRDFKLKSDSEELKITALELEQLVIITDKLSKPFNFNEFVNKDLLKVFIENNPDLNEIGNINPDLHEAD